MTRYENIYQKNKRKSEARRLRLTAQVSLRAYDAILACQRRHRTHTGEALSKWKVIDRALIHYARRQRIEDTD
jgi:hypothetical protein